MLNVPGDCLDTCTCAGAAATSADPQRQAAALPGVDGLDSAAAKELLQMQQGLVKLEGLTAAPAPAAAFQYTSTAVPAGPVSAAQVCSPELQANFCDSVS